MGDFREKLYEKYFESQAGRRLGKDLKDSLKSQWGQLENEILPLLPQERDSKILDLGCGYGSLVMLLKEKGYNNTEGIDISEDQVRMARQLGLDNVHMADVFEYLSERKGAYDVITAIDIIEHFSKDEVMKFLEAIHGALKKGGVAIFRTPNMDAPFTSTYAYGDFTHQTLLNFSSANQLFMSAGFDDISVLPSYVKVEGMLKESLRKVLWHKMVWQSKLALFTTGKSTKGVYFTPNLVIRAGK